jgi:hypothetical protein
MNADGLRWETRCCATLVFRFGIFALAPISLLAVGLTTTYGHIHQWGALVAVTTANLAAFHTAYWLAGLVSIGSAQKETLGPLHRQTKI